MKNFTVIRNEILEESQLTVPARYLLCVLLRHSGQKEWCYPSQKTLGKNLGYTPRYIRKLLKELEKYGLVVRKRKGFNKSNNYKVAKEYMFDRKQSSPHIGSKFPLNQGITLPPNNTYIKGKDKKSIQTMREALESKGILRTSRLILKAKL